ncbi:hypothetical protein [Paenibacillus sp. DYY-L-2]|uniref:hypothetical protein n=1 Tax=Paenibacillus sp. DYY-L-2 TaxID=3447013 RepID=UPI003F4FA56D
MDSWIEGWLGSFAGADREQRNHRKRKFIDRIPSSGEVQAAIQGIAGCLKKALQDDGREGFVAKIEDAELVGDLLEIAYETVRPDAELAPYMMPVARFMHIDKKATDKTDAERYVQYRATVLMEAMLSGETEMPAEAAALILSNYYIRDIPTQELYGKICWRLSERGINICSRINWLHTGFHNYETPELAGNNLLALWSAIRKGYFDSPIPDSDKTYQVWLWHIVTSCVSKMKKKYREDIRLGAVGCLLDVSSRYPQTQRLILECMENWGIAEPGRPRNDLAKDLKELYARCREHPGTTCLPEGYVITKKGIMKQ